MPRGKQLNVTTPKWRKAIGSYQEKEFKKINESINIITDPSSSRAGNVKETYPELYRQFNQGECQFYRNGLIITQIKPGLLTTFLIFSILTRMALADGNVVEIQQVQNSDLRSDKLDYHTPPSYAYTPDGMWPKQQSSFTFYHSASDPLMKPYLEDPELLKLVEQATIVYTPIDYANFKISEGDYVKVCNDMIKMIRINLAYVLNTQLLKQLLKEHGIKITIVHPFFIGYNQGVYDYHTNTILIAWDQYFSNSEIRNVLKNEIHHMAVCIRNGGRTETCITPPTFKKLNKIIARGNKKINEYAELFRLGHQLKDLEAIIDQYEPMLFQLPVTVYDYNMLMETTSAKILEDGRIFVPKGEAPMAGEGHYDKTLVNNDFYIKLCQVDSDNIIYKICFAKDSSVNSKMTAFFIDWDIRQFHYVDGYGDSSFFKTNLNNRVSEFASDLEELPKGLKELFYPKFCEIFSQFHNVDDYCSRPAVPFETELPEEIVHST
ncbi:MAG: hypothetical protein H0U71_02950 [Gammaproteobacteria bacterium]|nr:hypothetical protein [Gammaproteobacteria bacterium]